MQVTDPTKIPGWGVDRRPELRPGVPMEMPPRAAQAPAPPEQAVVEPPLPKSASLERMTPVFGTAVPPRGLSGLLRRAAYRIPEHRPSHWLLLLLSDRVDVVEGLLGDLAGGLGGLGARIGPRRAAIGLGALAAGLIGLGLFRRRHA